MAALMAFVGVVALAGFARRALIAPSRRGARRRLHPRVRHSLEVWLRERWRRRADVRSRVEGLPLVLEDVARGLRAGLSLRQACADASSGEGVAASELRATIGLSERGVPLPAAFRAWARAPSPPEVRLAAGALSLAATAGGPQARAVDGVAATLRERRAAAGDVRAHSAQARLSAYVIGALPAAFAVWALATDRRTAAFLVGGPAGWLCLASGIGLEVAGGFWMRRVLRGAIT